MEKGLQTWVLQLEGGGPWACREGLPRGSGCGEEGAVPRSRWLLESRVLSVVRIRLERAGLRAPDLCTPVGEGVSAVRSAVCRLGLYSLFHKSHCQSTAINHTGFPSTTDLSRNQKTVSTVVITHS